MDHSHDHGQSPVPPPFFKSPAGIALAMLALIVAFYLLREHWQHLAGNWSYLLLLACPLMHVFHGHGGHYHGSGRGPTDPNQRNS